MQRAGVHDPLPLNLFGAQGQAGIAAAEHGALSVVVDQDEGLVAGGSSDVDDPGLDARALELASMKTCGIVVAQLAYVAGVETPARARYYRRGYLSAGHHGFIAIADLGAPLRVMVNGDHRIRGIQANTD
jgi:hypothetical protein